MQHLPALVLLLCCAAFSSAAHASATLSASAPYTELIAQRYTDAAAPRIAQWPPLCTSNVSRLAALPFASATGSAAVVLLQSAQGAFLLSQSLNSRAGLLTGAPADSACFPLPLELHIPDWRQAAVAAWATPAQPNNATLLVASPAGLAVLSCIFHSLKV